MYTGMWLAKAAQRARHHSQPPFQTFSRMVKISSGWNLQKPWMIKKQVQCTSTVWSNEAILFPLVIAISLDIISLDIISTKWLLYRICYDQKASAV